MDNDSNALPLVILMGIFIIAIMCATFYVIGEDNGRDKFVNKVCQQTQYEFCQPTYVYKAKGGNNE